MTQAPDPTAEFSFSSEADPAQQDAASQRDDPEADRRRKALARLLMRVSEQADFPSLKESIGAIQSITRSDRAHLRQLSDQVLNDVALTGKLLRIINAAFYKAVGGGEITSMQRAVALIGFDSVGMLAASLLLFERVPKGRDGESVRHAYSIALLGALLAQQLCRSSKHLESVYMTGLFMNLGNMLLLMHFPLDARTLKKKVEDSVASMKRQAEANAALHTGAVKKVSRGITAEQVHNIKQRIAREVIGLTLEEFGIEVALQWGWPEHLAKHLRAMYPVDPEREVDDEDYLRVLCTATSDLSAALHALPRSGPPDEVLAARELCIRRFGEAIGVALALDPKSLPDLGELAMQKWSSISAFLGIKPDGTSTSTAANKSADVFQVKKPPVIKGPDRISKGLTHALKGLKESVDSAAPLEEVLEQMMADLLEALGLQRVVVCLRGAGRGDLQGKTGAGLRASAVTAAFHVALSGSQDLFSVSCINSKDMLVADAGDPSVSKRLPPWFLQKVGARTFILLPMTRRSNLHGLIYLDRQMAGSLVLTDQEFALLRSVRDHLVMAMEARGLTG